MPTLNVAEREAFLTEKRIIMRVGVTRADGSPLVTPVWFLYAEQAIYFTPRERSEWFTCLRRDPRVALCIDEQPLPYRKVLVDGKAELVYDLGSDGEWRELYQQMAERYVPQADAVSYVHNTIAEPRALFRVRLIDARVRSWRLPVAGEDGTGIWHKRYYQDPDIQFAGTLPGSASN
jgi:nitroimidazol reductase NimA-like FMN-containing flavoprotein (pyridoxamine 5'-phosphate oxidase superfamily)